jgi:hypothetical protein
MGVPFSPRGVGGGSRIGAIRLGRQLDRAFTARVNLGTRNSCSGVSDRIRRVIAELGARGVHTIRSQVPVGMADRGIRVRTELDGIGCTRDGSPVVIELKATAATLAQHRAGYHRECTKRARLLSGHPNCCYWRHQLQLGFGALCTGARSGLVVVSCSDGATSYPLQVGMSDTANFRWPLAGGRGRTPGAPVEAMVAWPAYDQPLLAAIAQLAGLGTIGTWTITACTPASARLTGPSARDDVVVSIVVGQLTRRKRRLAVSAAIAVGGETRVIAWQGRRGWLAELAA